MTTVEPARGAACRRRIPRRLDAAVHDDSAGPLLAFGQLGRHGLESVAASWLIVRSCSMLVWQDLRTRSISAQTTGGPGG